MAIFRAPKPGGWNFTLAGLAAQSRDGIASIRSAVQELTGFGYLRRVQHHKPNGDFGEVECGVIASPAYLARQGLPPCGACTAAGN